MIGFVERGTGLAGIEHYLNQLETKHRLEYDRQETLPQVAESRPGIDGHHLILTLDVKIQRILESYLASLGKVEPGGKRGVLVMEAASGSLIGYAQTPSFDPNRFHAYPESVYEDIFDETIAVPEPFKLFLRDISLLESQAQIQPDLKTWSAEAEQRKLGVQLQLWDKLGIGSREQYDFISSYADVSERVAHISSPGTVRDFETVPVMQTPLQLITAVTRVVNGGIGVVPHATDRFVLRRNQQEFMIEDLSLEGQTGLIEKVSPLRAANYSG